MARTRQYPARDLADALREYAPGSDVVVDGRVLASAGLTLNWKIPAGDKPVHEIQARRYAWHCGGCGTIGTSFHMPETCESSACGAHSSLLRSRNTWSQLGLRLTLAQEAITTSAGSHMSLQEGRGSRPGERNGRASPVQSWGAFATVRTVACSSTPTATVMASLSAFGADAQLSNTVRREKGWRSPPQMQNHRALRGGSATGPDGRCQGNDGTYAIQRNEWLGVSKETDVFELQLRSADNGQPLEEVAASSVAVALRQVLAAKIGVEEREIGWGRQGGEDRGNR